MSNDDAISSTDPGPYPRSSLWLILCSVALTVVWDSSNVHASQLPPERIEAWNDYVRLTEARIAGELSADSGFLVQDFENPDERVTARAALFAGERPLSRMKSVRGDADDIDVPGGMIHHWRGAIFIPGVTLDEVLNNVMQPDAAELQQEDVLETRVLDRGEDWLDLYLKLQRSKIVTATYNSEHHVEYVRHGAHRASSKSVATYLRELDNAGTPEEREKREGQDRGFLWRLNSYWRYEQVEGGVVVECESLTLSRSIPFLAVLLVRPIVTSVAKESLDRTLTSLRERMMRGQPAL